MNNLTHEVRKSLEARRSVTETPYKATIVSFEIPDNGDIVVNQNIICHYTYYKPNNFNRRKPLTAP